MKLSVFSPLVRFSLCAVCALGLAGCASSFDPMDGTTPAPSPSVITGTVWGGRQPIVGAHVYMFSPSTTAYGGKGIAASSSNASVSLLNNSDADGYPTTSDGTNYYVTTDANGNFGLTGEYTCTSGQPVYLYSMGGNPGGGTNTAAGLMAVLGTCPLSSSLVVDMNEMSTVATAYAIAGFATDATHIGTSGSTLAATGIANAFANAAQMYQLNGLSGGPAGGGSALATTPGNGTNGGTGTVPQQELNSLANILAACVNSVGPGSPSCSNLFSDAESAGTTGSQATDTATEAIYIAQNPYTANITALFNVGGSTGPYAPTLSTAPENYTVVLTFTGAGLQATIGQPHGLAIDSSGNAWIASYFGTVLSEFSPLGVPANTSGFSSTNLTGPVSVALDANSSHVWIGNYNNGTVLNFTISGATFAKYTPTGLIICTDVAIDGSGNAWVAGISSDSSLYKLNSSGVQQGSAITGNGLADPMALAIEAGASGNVWVANFNATNASVFTNAGAALYDDTNGGVSDPNGVAIDSGGFAWFANNASHVSKLSSDGSSGSSFALPELRNNAVAIDGAGNAWITNLHYLSQTLYEVTNSGTNLSGTSGFLPANGTAKPDALAIDGSGNVWYSDENSSNLYEMIGAATPVVTPIAYGVANSLLGTRP